MPHVAPILDFLNMTNDAGQTTDLYSHFWLYRPTFEAYHLQSEFNFLLFFFGSTGHRVNLEDFSPKKIADFSTIEQNGRRPTPFCFLDHFTHIF